MTKEEVIEKLEREKECYRDCRHNAHDEEEKNWYDGAIEATVIAIGLIKQID